jgi:hypothetical protein
LADYKRMVSYMYQYENGVKKKNVGYARVEAKNGQCKITLHMQLLGQLDSVFPTYLIQRGEDRIELVYLGDTMLKNQVMDSKLTADEANIMGSGYSLSDVGGLLIFLNDSIFFATEWDDKPIVAKEVLDAMKPRQKAKPAPSRSNVPLKSGSESKADTREELQEKKPAPQAGRAGVPDRISRPETAPITEYAQKELTLEEELKIPKYKLPRGWKTVERLQKPDAAEVIGLYAAVEAAVREAEQPVWQSGRTENNIPDGMDLQDINFIRSGHKPPEDYRQQEELQQRDAAQEDPGIEVQAAADMDQEAARHFFDNYPRIYPFEDNEIILCVKIEPKDIGLLPKDIWALSNNSFLMHGFYCYHHLIFAKMRGGSGFNYILGVPGIFHNRERFMARMFGFENFKSIRKRELRQGDFGYWYLPISL